MNIEWNWKTIAITAGAALLLVGTNAGQYFVVWKPHDKEVKMKYEEQLATLQATVDAIGPTTGVWVVKEGNTSIFPGKEIKPEDLEIRELPASFLTSDGYVLDPSEVKGKFFKLALQPGTPLTQDLVMANAIDDTSRYYDVVASLLPIGIKVGDYVDFRLTYPLGEDYIVLAHKRIEEINAKTVKFVMNETEIHLYQSALVDYFIQMQMGAQLYMAKYVEPGAQKPAEKYYAVPKNILAIITANPNIVTKVNASINNGTRGIIDAGTAAVTQEIGSKINAGRNEQSSKLDQGATEAQQEREKAQQEAGVYNPFDPTGTAGAAQPGNNTPPAEQPAGTTPPANTSNPTGSGTKGNTGTKTPPATNNTPSSSSPLNIDKGVVE